MSFVKNEKGEQSVDAADNGRIEDVKRLIQEGVPINYKTMYGWTVLLVAATNGYDTIVSYVISNGADVNIKNNNGETALHQAAYKGYDTIVSHLISNGADVNVKNNGGETALIRATEKGHDTIVSHLISNGADVNVKDKYGQTALDEAKKRFNNKIIKLLEEAPQMLLLKNCYEEWVKTLDFSDNLVRLEQLREYDYVGWFYLISESMNDESNKINNFIIQTLSSHPEMMIVSNSMKKFAYDYITKNQSLFEMVLDRELFTYDHMSNNNNNALWFILLNLNHNYCDGRITRLIIQTLSGHPEMMIVSNNSKKEFAYDYIIKNQSLFAIVLDRELITYDHMSNNNNNALWFILLNLNDDYEGRLPQLIIQTLSSHPEMMIVNNSKKEFAYDYIIKNQSLFAMVLNRELITYDHMSNNNNALWFILLNLNDDYEGRLPQLIIQTLSNHPEMMIVNNSKKEFAYDYIIKNQSLFAMVLDRELITYDNMSNNNNALWFILLNLNDDYEGRLPQLIIQTLSNHPEMMIVNNGRDEFTYDYIIKNQSLFAIVLDREIITYDHMLNNSNALWFILLNLNHEYEGRLPQLIIQTLSNHPELSMAISSANHETAWLILFPKLDKISMPLSVWKYDNYVHWFNVIVREEFVNVVKKVAELFPELIDAKDSLGRIAVRVATPSNMSALQSIKLIHGRYSLTEKVPDHTSATCYVYKAIDEKNPDIDEFTGQPIPRRVALKLMRRKDQFIREIETRKHSFNEEAVMDISDTFPSLNDPTFADRSDVSDSTPFEFSASGAMLGDTKHRFESYFMVVLPLGERNMFVALKQERFAGKDFKQHEVVHIFKQLLFAVSEMHSKSILHADLKPLNLVRVNGSWRLIDLDAACVIGKDPVGFKSSSAFIPPEAIFIDPVSKQATVKSPHNNDNHILIADPSFDVWSLGCLLYPMVHPDVMSLFNATQDDNLNQEDLSSLASWSDNVKTNKLAAINHLLARNLLSQMLQKDPSKRPTIQRILNHPFLTGNKVARMIGEPPKFGYFISYRVKSDFKHAEKLYNMLIGRGHTVWWDKECLAAGVDWEEGFCSGLMNCRDFICIMSRGAINNDQVPWQNFSKLSSESKCDNVYLEYRLAVEIRNLGLIERLFPVMIGDEIVGEDGGEGVKYDLFFERGCVPSAPQDCVLSVEKKLHEHMEREGLGSPLESNKTVKSVLDDILKCNGAKIEGGYENSFIKAVEYLETSSTNSSSSSNNNNSLQVNYDNISSKNDMKSNEYETLLKEKELWSKERDLLVKREQESAKREEALLEEKKESANKEALFLKEKEESAKLLLELANKEALLLKEKEESAKLLLESANKEALFLKEKEESAKREERLLWELASKEELFLAEINRLIRINEEIMADHNRL